MNCQDVPCPENGQNEQNYKDINPARVCESCHCLESKRCPTCGRCKVCFKPVPFEFIPLTLYTPIPLPVYPPYPQDPYWTPMVEPYVICKDAEYIPPDYNC